MHGDASEVYRGLESELRRIDGVEGAVFIEERGRRRQLRVFVTRRGGDIEGEVGRMLAAHGVGADEVLVTATGPAAGDVAELLTTPQRDRPARVAFHDVVVRGGRGSSRAVATLRDSERYRVGEAARTSSVPILDVAAEATVDALRDVVLDDVRVVAAAAVEIVSELAVCVTVHVGDARHIGTCLLRSRSLPEAAGRATLDALNRLLALDAAATDTVPAGASTTSR